MVVTAVVAICSAVAQLLCPGLIAHCFSVSPHTTVSQIAGHVYSVHVIKFVCQKTFSLLQKQLYDVLQF